MTKGPDVYGKEQVYGTQGIFENLLKIAVENSIRSKRPVNKFEEIFS